MEQTPNILPYFITGMVMMLIGWAMGFFDSNLRTSKKIKEAEDSAQVAINEAKSKIAQAEVKLASVAGQPSHADGPGILRVKNENGFLTLDLDGASVNPAAMTAEQRKRLVEMLALMRPWLEGKAVSIPTPTQPLPPEDSLRSAFDLSPLPAISPKTETATPKVPSKEEHVAPPAAVSIVAQIDLMLQARLLGTPLASRGIYLAESLQGGVIVYVGNAQYMGVDEVPDPEVKAAIRGAIQEWENKYTPGL